MKEKTMYFTWQGRKFEFDITRIPLDPSKYEKKIDKDAILCYSDVINNTEMLDKHLLDDVRSCKPEKRDRYLHRAP